jgi:hypothetical protein
MRRTGITMLTLRPRTLLCQTEVLQNIRLQLAYHMFRNGKYAEAMQLMKELRSNPLRVIGLFPKLLPMYGDAVGRCRVV